MTKSNSLPAAVPDTEQNHVVAIHDLRNATVLAVVGLVAAGISHVAIQQTGEVFQLSQELLRIKYSEGRNQSPAVMRMFYEGLTALNYKNAALWIGMSGAIVGLLFGLTLGWVRRTVAAVILGSLAGLVLGGGFAAAAGLVANFLGENLITPARLEATEIPPHYLMLLHGATWGVVGLGVGLGTGLGAAKDRWKFALGSLLIGAIAGGAGGAFYPFATTVFLPFANPSLTVPEGDLNRFVWLAMPFSLMGLTLGRRG